MPSTYTALHYHIIFSTKNREKCLSASWLGELHDYLGGILRGLDAQPEGIGGVSDHVHVLVSLKPNQCVSDIMREMKKASTKWVRDKLGTRGFHWQEGYAAFTVSVSSMESVRTYIAKQEEHHRHKTYREELVEFLEKTGVGYDVRYLD